MKTSVDTDLTIEPSEEAKICLTCTRKRCTLTDCSRLKQMKEELKQKKTTPKQKNF